MALSNKNILLSASGFEWGTDRFLWIIDIERLSFIKRKPFFLNEPQKFTKKMFRYCTCGGVFG